MEIKKFGKTQIRVGGFELTIHHLDPLGLSKSDDEFLGAIKEFIAANPTVLTRLRTAVDACLKAPKHANYEVLVAEWRNQVVGMRTFYRDEPSLDFVLTTAKSDKKIPGLGRLLTHFAIKIIRNRGDQGNVVATVAASFSGLKMTLALGAVLTEISGRMEYDPIFLENLYYESKGKNKIILPIESIKIQNTRCTYIEYLKDDEKDEYDENIIFEPEAEKMADLIEKGLRSGDLKEMSGDLNNIPDFEILKDESSGD